MKMNDFRLGIIGYLPPPGKGHPEAFLKNIRQYPPMRPLVLFSDHDYGDGIIKIPASPELAKTDSNKMAVQNLIFWTAVRMAASMRFTHILIIESDCRVSCKYWDARIWDEFMDKNQNAVAGGSITIFNPCSVSGNAGRRFEQFVIETANDRPMPLSITGSANLAEFRPSCVFPNGAFGIYRMDWILKTFPQVIGKPSDYYELAQKNKTWDYHIGDKLWSEFGDKIYDNVVSIGCVYSGYGNVMSDEEERKKLLESGRVVGIHQIKSDWCPSPIADPPFRGVEPSKTQQIVKKQQRLDAKVELFVVTYGRDFRYLKYFLKSVEKYASGFYGMTILVPDEDFAELKRVVADYYHGKIPVRLKHCYVWAGKGMLWHEAHVCRSEKWCPKADFVAHIDPDCIFTGPTTPEDYFEDGKPILPYENFDTLIMRQPGTIHWKKALAKCLPFPVDNEFMRRHPEVYHIGLYEKLRQQVEEKTSMEFNNYVRSCQNEYPQGFTEYPALGAVAAKYFPELYHLHDCATERNPDKSPYPVQQCWSHVAPDEPCELWVDGERIRTTAIELYEGAGLI